MALRIVWTNRAIQGFDNIISYLEDNWTDKEVLNFVKDINEFLELLKYYPELLQKSQKEKNIFRGPVNKLTIMTYRIKPKLKTIEIINIRSSRKKP